MIPEMLFLSGFDAPGADFSQQMDRKMENVKAEQEGSASHAEAHWSAVVLLIVEDGPDRLAPKSVMPLRKDQAGGGGGDEGGGGGDGG